MKKYKTKDMDQITLKIMKIIIVVFFVICIVIEFFSDIFSGCGIFLQHKDFFENILLGVLGSAVITYIVSHLLYKQRKKEKEDVIKQYLNEVGRKYWDLYLYNDVSIDEYKIKSNQLQKAAEKLITYCEEFYTYNRNYKELIKICKDTLIPLCVEVNVFSEVLERGQNTIILFKSDNQSVESQDLKEIYTCFIKYLNEKFNLEEINQRFYKFSMIYGEIMEQIEKDKKEFWELYTRIKLETQYNEMIKKCIDQDKI